MTNYIKNPKQPKCYHEFSHLRIRIYNTFLHNKCAKNLIHSGKIIIMPLCVFVRLSFVCAIGSKKFCCKCHMNNTEYFKQVCVCASVCFSVRQTRPLLHFECVLFHSFTYILLRSAAVGMWPMTTTLT